MERHTVNNKYVVGEKLGREVRCGVFRHNQEDEHARRDKVCGQRRRTRQKHEATILNYLYRRSVKHVPFVYGTEWTLCPNRTNPRCA
jgi:hypothetical protein